MLLYTPPKTTRIPVVDLGPSLSGVGRNKTAVADEIRKAARGTGFFYVANHGIDPGLTEGVFAEAKRFFSLPLEAEFKRSAGYEPLEALILDTGSPGDFKEPFSFAGDLPPDHPHIDEHMNEKRIEALGYK